jgi:hypothetical protein
MMKVLLVVRLAQVLAPLTLLRSCRSCATSVSQVSINGAVSLKHIPASKSTMAMPSTSREYSSGFAVQKLSTSTDHTYQRVDSSPRMICEHLHNIENVPTQIFEDVLLLGRSQIHITMKLISKTKPSRDRLFISFGMAST